MWTFLHFTPEFIISRNCEGYSNIPNGERDIERSGKKKTEQIDKKSEAFYFPSCALERQIIQGEAYKVQEARMLPKIQIYQ